MKLLKKFIIVVCVICMIVAIFNYSYKYYRQKKLEQLISIIYDENIEINNDVVKELEMTCNAGGEVDTYEEYYLNASLKAAKGDNKAAIKDFLCALEYIDDCDKRANIYKKIGIIYINESNYNEALGYFDKALNEVERDPNALLFKAECFLQLNNYPDALSYMEKYLKDNELTSAQFSTILTMYLTIGNYDDVIRNANKAIDKYPSEENEFILYRLQANLMKEDIEAAIIDADRYKILENNETPSEILVASYLYTLENYSLALKMYKDYMTEHDDIPLYEQAIECAYQIDDYTEMLNLSNEALKKIDKEEDKIDYYKWKAVALMQKEKFSEAISLFTKYLDVYETHYEITYLRGLCYFTTSSYKKAIDDFSECIDNNTLVEDSLYNRSLCYASINDTEKTIEDLKAIIELSSGSDTYNSAIELLRSLEIE